MTLQISEHTQGSCRQANKIKQSQTTLVFGSTTLVDTYALLLLTSSVTVATTAAMS